MLKRELAGTDVAGALRAAAAHLAVVAPAIDAINVYPVPDGDTGSNMAATMRAAVGAIATERGGADVVLAEAARGALYGARGNSGVILSQALRGLAEGVQGRTQITAPVLKRALELAADAAYAAIAQPQEGTMLTVLRAAANGATGDDCPAVLASATAAAVAAEARTIDQLPRLKEAGVTDAGGEGICAILRALSAHVSGAPLPVVDTREAVAVQHADHGEEFGFCTEFLVEPAAGRTVDIDALRTLAEGGSNRSAIVVGDATLARVHVHTDDADRLLAAAGALGRLSRVKVDDMGRQHERLRATGSGATAGVALLALCDGEGFAAAFERMGARAFLQRGESRPSAGDVQRAIDGIGAPVVFVLPNHKDLVPVARQAATLARAEVRVVESRTMPQGLAACVAFDAAMPLDALEDTLRRQLETARTVEVTVATASRLADGVAIKAGDAIALLDGRVVVAATEPLEALRRGLPMAGAGSDSLVSVYTEAKAGTEGLAETVEGWLPDCEVRVAWGGQHLYPFIASVE